MSILYVNTEMRVEDVMDMKFFKFIKTYEASMAKLNLQPLISLNSGKGIFDYNRAVQQWWSAVKGK